MRGFRARILSAIVGDGVGPGEQIVQEVCVRIVHVLGDLREQVLEISNSGTRTHFTNKPCWSVDFRSVF